MNRVEPAAPIITRDATVIPLVRTSLNHYGSAGGGWLQGHKEPVAIVVCDAQGHAAFDMQGASVRVGDLTARVPGLESVLARYSDS